MSYHAHTNICRVMSCIRIIEIQNCMLVYSIEILCIQVERRTCFDFRLRYTKIERDGVMNMSGILGQLETSLTAKKEEDIGP